MPSIQVQEYELADLFDALGLFRRIENGELSEHRRGPGDPAKRCSLGGESYYTRTIDPHDGYRGRIHYVSCVFGHVIGRWPSALTIGDVTIYRQGHQRRPDV